MKYLKGKKTYIAGSGLIVLAVLGAIFGKFSPEQVGQLLFEGLGLIGLRNAIK